MNHLVLATEVTDKQFCGALCFLEDNCMSYNLITGSEAENHKCELNNATHEGHESDLVDYPGCIYRAAKVQSNNRCSRELTSSYSFSSQHLYKLQKGLPSTLLLLYICFLLKINHRLIEG